MKFSRATHALRLKSVNRLPEVNANASNEGDSPEWIRVYVNIGPYWFHLLHFSKALIHISLKGRASVRLGR